MVRRLTEEAQDDRDDFDSLDWGCSCFINPPCTYCTHPGNPLNQENDESCWEDGEDDEDDEADKDSLWRSIKDVCE